MLRNEPTDIEDRLKILVVDRQTMLGVLRGQIEIDLDLPDDAAVREVQYDYPTRGFALLIWSYAFDPVPTGCEIARLPPFTARSRTHA